MADQSTIVLVADNNSTPVLPVCRGVTLTSGLKAKKLSVSESCLGVWRKNGGSGVHEMKTLNNQNNG